MNHQKLKSALAFFSRSAAFAAKSSLSHVRRAVLSTPAFATMALSPSDSLNFLSFGIAALLSKLQHGYGNSISRGLPGVEVVTEM